MLDARQENGKDTDNKSSHGHDNAGAQPQIPPAPIGSNARDNDTGQPHDRTRYVYLKRDCVDFINTTIIALAFLAACYAGYQAGRLADLTKTAVENASGDSVRQAADTQTSLTLTRQVAYAARRSADVAEAGVRAWVAPIAFTFRDFSDKIDPLIVRVAYQNVGRQPARNVRNWSALDRIYTPSVPPSRWGELQEWQNVTRFGPREICDHIVGEKTRVLYPTSIPTLTIDVGSSEKFSAIDTVDYLGSSW